ncbi:hypothetical protein SteCoe_1725 [Stentor coeruleus]|uniref:Uncharacterized protein n=1 Tax=Stentor coeruleus TaxID=5963 RepID=A0A1R2D188_9CILI|nr:hypothetical protein SteCoe_1725 [Stentor coeruleus]
MKSVPPNLQMNLDGIDNFYNPKEGKFDTPFTGPIKIPRGTFQLSVPPIVKIGESSSLPVLPMIQDNHLHIIQELKDMVPSTTRPKKNLKYCLRSSIRQLKNLRIHPEEFAIVNKLMPQVPYGRPHSREFLSACKDGNILEVEIMLTNDKFLAYVFDSMKMTALHWACLRGYLEIIKLLLGAHAFVDAVDMSHRTPLHIAAKNGSILIVEELLRNKADFSIVTAGKKTALQLCKDEATKETIKRVMREKYASAFMNN